MNTQVIFKIDEKLKKAAQVKAKKQGISLSDFYKSATRSFVAGTSNAEVVFYPTITPNAKTGKELLRARKEIKAGIGLSPVFHSTEEMDRHLDNLK